MTDVFKTKDTKSHKSEWSKSGESAEVDKSDGKKDVDDGEK